MLNVKATMRIKKGPGKKSEFIGLRLTLKDLNKIRQRSLIYCEGNISEFVLYAALNYTINRKDLEEGALENLFTPTRLPQGN